MGALCTTPKAYLRRRRLHLPSSDPSPIVAPRPLPQPTSQQAVASAARWYAQAGQPHLVRVRLWVPSTGWGLGLGVRWFGARVGAGSGPDQGKRSPIMTSSPVAVGATLARYLGLTGVAIQRTCSHCGMAQTPSKLNRRGAEGRGSCGCHHNHSSQGQDHLTAKLISTHRP